VKRRPLLQALGASAFSISISGCIDEGQPNTHRPTTPEKRVQTTAIAVTHNTDTDSLIVTHSGGAAIASGEILKVTLNNETVSRKRFTEPIGNGGELFYIENISNRPNSSGGSVTVELEAANRAYEFENTGQKQLNA